MQKSVLLGNYEFYYAGGLFKKLFGLETSEDMKPLCKKLQRTLIFVTAMLILTYGVPNWLISTQNIILWLAN